MSKATFRIQKRAKTETKMPGKPRATREYRGVSMISFKYFVNTAAVSSIDSLCLITIRLTDVMGTPRDSIIGITVSSV